MTDKSASIEKVIAKKFGEDILVSGDSICDQTQTVIPVCPAVDDILNGGIPEGSVAIFTGVPKSGKTSTALHFAGNAQHTNSEFGPRHVYYFDIEGRIKSRDIKGIKHLITSSDRFTVIKSCAGKILTAEEFIEIGECLINDKPGCVFIFDSFSALCTSEEYTADIGKRHRADAPLLLARFCRRIANVVAVNKSIVMGITHLIANQGAGMATWVEASGRKLQYQADVKLKITHFKLWDDTLGQDINWLCQTSPLGPPGRTCVSKFRYDYGLDKELELIDLCIASGIIKQGGAWFTLGEEKFHGKPLVREMLIQKPKIYDKLNHQVREMLGLQQ